MWNWWGHDTALQRQTAGTIYCPCDHLQLFVFELQNSATLAAVVCVDAANARGRVEDPFVRRLSIPKLSTTLRSMGRSPNKATF